MNDPTQEREIPEDQQRKQIMTLDVIRRYLRQRTDGTNTTYSQQIDEWLPDETETFHALPDEDVSIIKVVPETHERVMSMCGKRVSPGDVIAYYALVDAVDRGDVDVAADIAETIPDRLWDVLEIEDDD